MVCHLRRGCAARATTAAEEPSTPRPAVWEGITVRPGISVRRDLLTQHPVPQGTTVCLITLMTRPDYVALDITALVKLRYPTPRTEMSQVREFIGCKPAVL